jgi:hypothetical protein
MCNNKVRQRNTSNCTSNNYTCSTRSSNSDTPQLAAA